jgi:hypothetical protein
MTEVCDAEWREVKARQWRARLPCANERHIGRVGSWIGKERCFAVSYVIEKRNVNALNQQRRRVLAAWVCLFAAVALYAPLAGAAWSAHAMSCCTGEYCPIAEHHHHKKQIAPHPDMDCGHDMGAMMDCSMSCCEGPEKPLVTAVAFVLPDVTIASALFAVTDAADSVRALAIPRSLEPVSPPPRFAHAS